MADSDPVPHGESDSGPIISVPMPDAGGPETRVKLGVWLVEPGDDVAAGQVIAELLLPGLLFELTTPVAGRIARLLHPADSVATPGTVLCEVSQRDLPSPE